MSTSKVTEVKVPLIRTDPHIAFAVAPYDVDPVRMLSHLKSGFFTAGSIRVPPTIVIFSLARFVSVIPGVNTSNSDQVTVRCCPLFC